jgi:ParB family chromosome partitioning protein
MKHDTIISTIEQVPFADLYVSNLNPRTVFDPQGIEALATNIRQLGLIQNLAGLRDGEGRIGIVAGGGIAPWPFCKTTPASRRSR